MKIFLYQKIIKIMKQSFYISKIEEYNKVFQNFIFIQVEEYNKIF